MAPRPDPTRVMFLGDVHGRIGALRWALRAAAERGVDAVVQAGDFGYWEHRPWGADYLDAAQAAAEESGIDVYFIRGNHDNIDLLEDYRAEPGEFAPVRPRILWVPDATRWSWSGVSFAAAGGAPSIDRAYRHEGINWWRSETLGLADARRLVEGGVVDVLVSHDAPSGAALGPLTDFPDGDLHRDLLRDVVEALAPHYVFHGHYHRRLTWVLPLARSGRGAGHVVRGESLDCDGGLEDSIVVADVADLAAAEHPAFVGAR